MPRARLSQALARAAEEAWAATARAATAGGRFAYRRTVAERLADAG
ncbi:hypothetical protein QMO56_20795 [Roseomonas sp. E05]|nr:hypothetical protein [Roseomonas sp. E05]MDJ0390554.1 hypothetical protein [Roseomonas sp. E05]